MPKRLNLIGKQFERLIVIGYSHVNKHGNAFWNTICRCGNEKIICGSSLVSKFTKSCGCLNKELIRARAWKGNGATYSTKHGWLKTEFGKANKCENKLCNISKPKRYEWANMSGKYLRERIDYIMLCCSCHKRLDRGVARLVV